MSTDHGGIAPLPLRWNFSWVLAGQVLYALSQGAMLVVLARLGSADMVGQFVLGVAICTPVFMLTNLDLQTVQATDVRREFRFGHYLALGLLTAPVGLAVVGAIAGVTGLGGSAALVVFAWGGARAVETVTVQFYGLYLRTERMDRMAGSLTLRAVAGWAALTVVLWATDSVALATLALAVSWMAVLLFYDVARGQALLRSEARHESASHQRLLRPRWEPAVLTRLFLISLPAGAGGGVASLIPNIPRYQIEVILDSAALGVFAAISYIIRLVELVSSALDRALVPRLAKAHAQGRAADFRRLLRRTLTGSIVLGSASVVAAGLFGESLLRIIFGEEYARGDVLIRVMVAAALLVTARFLLAGIVAVRRFRTRLVILSINAAVIGVVGIWLVNAQGIVGAANATIVGLVVINILGLTALWSVLRDAMPEPGTQAPFQSP